MNIKKILIINLGILLIISILIPVSAYSVADPSGPNNATSAGNERPFCERIGDFRSKVEERMSNQEKNITDKNSEISTKLQERWMEQDAKTSEKRLKWDENRKEHFVKLEEKAKNDAEKSALVVFQETVSTAVADRRAAINVAIVAFRQEVEKERGERRKAMEQVRITFKEDIIKAFESAETDCNAAVSPATVRQNLRSDIKDAKDKYQKSYRDIEKLEKTTDQFIATRKAAIEKAIKDFKAATSKTE